MNYTAFPRELQALGGKPNMNHFVSYLKIELTLPNSAMHYVSFIEIFLGQLYPSNIEL